MPRVFSVLVAYPAYAFLMRSVCETYMLYARIRLNFVEHVKTIYLASAYNNVNRRVPAFWNIHGVCLAYLLRIHAYTTVYADAAYPV